jgi:hypothetical protein
MYEIKIKITVYIREIKLFIMMRNYLTNCQNQVLNAVLSCTYLATMPNSNLNALTPRGISILLSLPY